MHKDYWHEKWQRADIGFHQATPHRFMQKFLPQCALPADATVLVPLCGKSIDMRWLLDQGYRVIGVECHQAACEGFFSENQLVAEEACDASFRVYRSPDHRVTLYCGDFFDFKPHLAGHIDVIYDRAALIALPPDLRVQYAAHVCRLAGPGMKVLLISMVYPEGTLAGPPFSVDETAVRALYERHFSIRMLRSTPIDPAPEHLRAKGFVAGDEQAWCMVRNILTENHG